MLGLKTLSLVIRGVASVSSQRNRVPAACAVCPARLPSPTGARPPEPLVDDGANNAEYGDVRQDAA
eukprot:6201712-Pleurochrysis_carterae.AAC.4